MWSMLFLLLTVFLAQPVLAQTGTCMQLGRGFTTCTDNTGRQSTIVDMGGGFQSYSDNKGNTGSIIDIGPNVKQFNIMPGTPPVISPPVFTPRTQMPLAPGLPGLPTMPVMPGIPDPTPMTPQSPMTLEPFGLK